MLLFDNDILNLPALKADELKPNELYVFLWKHSLNREELCLLANKIAPLLLDEKYELNSDKRFIERLSVRLLCANLFKNETDVVTYKSTGRPFLKNSSLEISISHTRNHYALSVASFRHGMDVEKWGEKAARVCNMFVNDEDFNLIKTLPYLSAQAQMTLLWSSKEAAYKYIDIEGISFRKDIIFFPLNNTKSFGASFANQVDKAFVSYITTPDCVLTCCGPSYFVIK